MFETSRTMPFLHLPIMSLRKSADARSCQAPAQSAQHSRAGWHMQLTAQAMNMPTMHRATRTLSMRRISVPKQDDCALHIVWCRLRRVIQAWRLVLEAFTT